MKKLAHALMQCTHVLVVCNFSKKKKGKRKKRKEKKNKNSFRKVFFNTARLVITGRAKCVMCYFLKN